MQKTEKGKVVYRCQLKNTEGGGHAVIIDGWKEKFIDYTYEYIWLRNGEFLPITIEAYRVDRGAFDLDIPDFLEFDPDVTWEEFHKYVEASPFDCFVEESLIPTGGMQRAPRSSEVKIEHKTELVETNVQINWGWASPNNNKLWFNLNEDWLVQDINYNIKQKILVSYSKK